MRLLLLAVLLPLCALADDITSTVQAPTQNTDGSTIQAGELVIFTWYYGICGDPESSADTDIWQPSFTFPATEPGEYCVQATVTNTKANESARSGIGTTTVTAPDEDPTPNPPTLVTVESTAYEIKVKGNGEIMLGRAIGTVPIGTPCSTTLSIGDYYQIPPDAVTLTKQKTFSDVYVARCDHATS